MAETNAASVNISVTFRHTDSSEALKEYVNEKISNCILKYSSKDADVHVVLSVEKRDHTAEAQLRSGPYEIAAKSTTEDLYSAIDKMVDALDVQLRKQKEKLSNHKHQPQQLTEV